MCGWGRILVPINFRLAPAEVEYIVEHSGASVLLVDPELEAACPASTPPTASSSGRDRRRPLPRRRRRARRAWAADEEATATINYTSGTTARPKGVQLTHRNCWVNAAVFGWHIQLSDRDVYLHTLPMFHANGWGMPWATTAMGCTQVVLRKVDGTEILRRVERHGVSLLCAAPAVVNAVLDAAAELGRARTRPGPHPHRGGRRPATQPDHRAGRVRARLGVHPDLRADRDLPAPDHQPAPVGVGRPRRRRPGPKADAGRGAGGGYRGARWTTTGRCWPGATR